MAGLSEQVKLLYRDYASQAAAWRMERSSTDKQVCGSAGLRLAARLAARLHRVASAPSCCSDYSLPALLRAAVCMQLKQAQAEAKDASAQAAAFGDALKRLEAGDLDDIKRQYVDAVRKAAVVQVTRWRLSCPVHMRPHRWQAHGSIARSVLYAAATLLCTAVLLPAA